jgi:hypothetical protein
VPASDAAPTGRLAKAGYPLTPGVSADPISDEWKIATYAQAQYESHADSLNQQRQGGVLLNQDRFLLRRGRIKVQRDFDYGQLILELDGNTTRGPAVRLQKAEASLIYGRSSDRDQPPIAQLSLGLFDLPFGFEMTYVPRVRWFTERTTASRAMFPSEVDAGVRLSGGLGFARYSVAVTNGEPMDEKSGFGLQDPNRNKDLTARVGAETHVSESFVAAGGISWNAGRGYHPGVDATKNKIDWKDLNENNTYDDGELSVTPGDVAKPGKSFARWAVGADLELLLRTGLGMSMLYGELVIASDMDRGLFLADPVQTGDKQRELSYYLAFTQQLTRYGVVGFRYEVYDPNADVLEKRAGRLLPSTQQVTTYSPLIGLVLPDHARLIFQWDIVDDYLARDSRGVPADFKNNAWTLRLQVTP